MKYVKLGAIALSLLFVFTTSFSNSSSGKKTLYPECKYAVDSVLEVGTGYIIIQGGNITGQTEGVDYNCLYSPSQTCTIVTDCRQVLELFNNQYMIVGWYNTTEGQYQD